MSRSKPDGTPVGYRQLSGLEREMMREVKSVGCDHTGSLASALHVPSSTARGALDRLETKSLVVGIKHDERDTIENGRVRIYWSLTDAGSAHLDQLKDDQQ